jgi:D-alanyl-D-alanine carboxypeptidase
MSGSPFLSPGRSRERQTLADRARRHRRRRVALAALAAAFGVALVLALVLAGSSREPRSAPRAAVHANASARPQTPLSAAGLPLARPALALSGLRTPALDPVHLAFARPPRAGLLFNLNSGQVLWERNPFRRERIASLTKMMTALVTVKSASPREPVLITRRAVEMPGSKVGVLPRGHHVRLESLLYGLMLPSGNDAAVALAEHVSHRVSAFVRRMNVEAAGLGLGCTRYSSPSGYYNAGNFSCASDLATLASADLKQARIARVAHTLSAALPFPIKGGKLFLYNNNPLLIYHYPGVTGLKTGYTEAAGRCLVATAERGGVRLGVVILHSSEPGIQARDLLNRAFEDVYDLKPEPEPEMPPGA